MCRHAKNLSYVDLHWKNAQNEYDFSHPLHPIKDGQEFSDGEGDEEKDMENDYYGMVVTATLKNIWKIL